MKIDPLPPSPPAFVPDDPRYDDPRDLEYEMRRVFEICHGCRMCVNYCGTFPDIFARVDRDIETKGAEGAEQLSNVDFESATDLCWQCKLCYIKCPYTPDEGHEWQVDVPRLLTREKVQRAKRNGISLQDRFLGEPGVLGALSSGPMSSLTNFVSANRLVRGAQEKVLGISKQFPLPPFAPQSFARWLSAHEPLPGAGSAGTVAIFATCLGDYNFPAMPANAVRVLEKNGFNVVRPEQTCCGLPNLDGGDIRLAREKAETNIASLLREVDEGRKIVVTGPSCSYTIRKEYPGLVGTAAAQRLADNTLDIMEFLDQLRKDKRLNREFQKGFGNVAYHAPCHLRAQKIGVPGARLLGLLPETEVIAVEQCSAVDGTWGMKAQYYELGLKYAQKLVRGVENADANLVVSDCQLAAQRIRKENNVRVVHPVEALADAYGVGIASS